MAKISSRSSEDVKLLATAIMLTPNEDKWKVVGKIVDLGLMKFRGINFVLWLIKKWKGSAGLFQFFKIMSEKYPEAIDRYLEDTIRHIVNGKDKIDSASVGGWSQQEIDLLLDNVTFSFLKNKKEE